MHFGARNVLKFSTLSNNPNFLVQLAPQEIIFTLKILLRTPLIAQYLPDVLLSVLPTEPAARPCLHRPRSKASLDDTQEGAGFAPNRHMDSTQQARRVAHTTFSTQVSWAYRASNFSLDAVSIWLVTSANFSSHAACISDSLCILQQSAEDKALLHQPYFDVIPLRHLSLQRK